jgi:hypothetical protein
VYSTCSISPRENDRVVDEVVRRVNRKGRYVPQLSIAVVITFSLVSLLEYIQTSFLGFNLFTGQRYTEVCARVF